MDIIGDGMNRDIEHRLASAFAESFESLRAQIKEDIKNNIGSPRIKPFHNGEKEAISDVHALEDTIILDKAADILFSEIVRLKKDNSDLNKVTHKNGLSLDFNQYKRNAKVIIGTGTKN